MMEAAAQVIAFQKSWRSFSPITVCILAQCQCKTQGRGGGGGGGTRAPHLQRRGREYPKEFLFGHYMYCNGFVEFGEFWGVSMDRTTVMLTDQIRKRVCSPTDSRTFLPRAVG